MTRGSAGAVLLFLNSLILLFIISPLLVVFISSFGETMYLRFPPQGFTLKWYVEALEDPAYWYAFQTSLYVGAIAALVATVVGTSAAWALSRHAMRLRSGMESAFLLPLTMPHLILGIAILTLTQPLGFGGSIWRLVASHIVITIPYVLRVMMPVIAGLRQEVEEAAADLGATPGVAFLTVTLPLLLPPVLVSAALAFMVSFDELVLSLFLAPPAERTLPMQIFSNVEFGLDPTVGAVSTLLLAATFIVMLLGNATAGIRGAKPLGGKVGGHG